MKDDLVAVSASLSRLSLLELILKVDFRVKEDSLLCSRDTITGKVDASATASESLLPSGLRTLIS